MDRSAVSRWVDGYERAWRTAGSEALATLFAPDARYLVSPWATPVDGLEAIARMWDREREGPDEPFTLTHQVVAVEGDTAVVRVSVEYRRAVPSRWRDLWILRFGGDGRCTRFEEWPFAPGQPDGHQD